MERIYLQISFNEKDDAKKTARQNGTRINWDAGKKKWYWEGNGNLPECLEKYTYQTTRGAYSKRSRSFNSFLNSQAGRDWQRKQELIAAQDYGFETIEEFRTWNEGIKSEYEKESGKTEYICLKKS